MDPFSLVFDIAGLVGLATTTIRFATSYMSGVKNGKESISTLITELEALRINLASLDTFLRSASAKDLTFQPTSVLRSCTTACENSLKALCKKLGQVGESKTSRFLWPISEKDHQKIMQDLRNFSRWMQFALSIDGCSLLSRTSDDVLKVLKGQFEHFKMLQSLENTTSQLKDAVGYQNRVLQDKSIAKLRERILSWLSEISHDQKHYSVRQPRVAGTGSWLLGEPEFLKWRDGTSSSNVLWCHGLQGSGKSVLTSLIIDQLRGTNAGLSVAFFYFDFQDGEQQTPTAVLSSLLRQLVATMPDLPKPISDAYEKHLGSGSLLSLEELEELMQGVVKSLHQAIIVIDALDECDKSRHRRPFLLLLQRLQRTSNIRLFVTSRQNFQDITDVFDEYAQITITAHSFDLKCYMRQEIEIAGVAEMIDDTFANEMIRAVIAKAQGMFLLAILHFRSVLKEPTAGAMEDALASLSPSLDSAFEKTILRIQRLPESRRQLGINILMWISHAKRPLDVSELSDALSIKSGQTASSLKHRPSPSIMLECCQGLVSVEQNADYIHLAHYSIQEYLVKNSKSLFGDAQINLGSIALTYLRFDDFRNGPVVHEADVQDRIESYPFLPYASKFWGVHLRPSISDERTKNLILTFLDCPRAIACGKQIYMYKAGYKELYWNAEECLAHTALHICSYFGLDDLLTELLDQNPLLINTTTNIGSTPINQAASKGHISTVKLLLGRGADPYLENWYGNALHCAAEAGKSATIRELVTHGMSPNVCERYSRSPLSCTVDMDRAAAFETLINLGADINAIDPQPQNGPPILHQVAYCNCLNIMDSVLRHHWGELDQKLEDGRTALHVAADEGNLLMVRKLVEAGADVNARDCQGTTPLYYLEGIPY